MAAADLARRRPWSRQRPLHARDNGRVRQTLRPQPRPQRSTRPASVTAGGRRSVASAIAVGDEHNWGGWRSS
jgi:hypothetical protein